MRTMTKKAWWGNIINNKPKGQLLNKAFHYSTTGSNLEHNNFNQNLWKYTFSTFLLTSAIKQAVNDDKFVETKRADLVGESQSH